jgi:nucleoside diphosphate kinase
MKQTLSYVIVTPYSIVKSRTGGVISRLLSRSNLELVGAQIIAPDESFVKEYADTIRSQSPQNLSSGGDLLADYIERNFGPSGGRRHRSLLLLFRGENPCEKLSDMCGPLFPENRNLESLHGETIRDTYADLILDYDDPNKVIYFEPAVLTPRHQELADNNMAIFARHFKNGENVASNMSYPDSAKIEQTMVILKPDNWNYASSKPGAVIDMFSRTGLRIVGIKIFRFSMNQALDFYSPVEPALMAAYAPIIGRKAREILEKEFQHSLSDDTGRILVESFGRKYAREQFLKIVEFMSGRRPNTCPADEADKPGSVKCMILLYEGENAIQRIRDVLGPTDPLEAPGGTVRREFGSSTMFNTAHASDSAENCEREKRIVKINENSLVSVIEDYMANRKNDA